MWQFLLLFTLVPVKTDAPLTSGFKTIDTIRYYSTDTTIALFYVPQPDNWNDSLYNVRFTAPASGTLIGAGFRFYHLVGTGNIRIMVWGSDGEFPTTLLGTVEIPTSTIDSAGATLTYVDLSSLNLHFNAGEEFHIGYGLGVGVDTLGLVLDTMGNSTGYSSRMIDMYSDAWEHTDSWISGVEFHIEAYFSPDGGSGGVDLAPYQPAGWSAPLVISATPGDTNSPPPGNFNPGDTVYLHWAVANFGTDTIYDTTYIQVSVDGNPLETFLWPHPFPGNVYLYYTDYPFVINSDGDHVITLTADPDNTISETNESNNEYSATYTWGSGGGGGSDTGTIDFVIITSSQFAPYFTPLKEWKDRKGIRTKIYTLDYIYANYTGYDNAEKIRNFIKDMHENHGTMYVLLGGQCDWENGHEIVPRRDAYVFTSNAGYYTDEDTLITDMYFSNLDGDWDANGNHVYGEMNDNVDLYPDIYVGRAPVRTVAQVQNFVNKVLAYEQNPDIDANYIKNSYHPQGNLWNTNHGTGMPDTMTQFDPPDWSHVYLREDIEGISNSSAVSTFNQGFNLVHFVGHGNERGVYYNYGYNTMMSNSDADGLSNGLNRLSIVNSIACFAGAMDEVSGGDCFAEHLVNATNGGAVAVMMNSRYGWGYSSPEGALGPSGEQSKFFYRALHQNNLYVLGQTWAQMNSYLAPYASDEYVRWCLYERNLFGDPTLDIWTELPIALSITTDKDSLPPNYNASLTVQVSANGNPVSNATITAIMKNGSGNYIVYLKGTTNSSGQVVFNINPPDTGRLIITATKHNYIYAQKEIIVSTEVGIDEQVLRTTDIKLQANMVSRILPLVFTTPASIKLEVSIYNVAGQKLYNKKFDLKGTGIITVNIANLKNGLYFVKLKYLNKTKLYKFLKTQ